MWKLVGFLSALLSNADPAVESQPVNEVATPSAEQPAVAQPFADDRLIYSVNRTPERLFDTARSVEVITSEDIWRKNARSLPEVLMGEAGIFVQQTEYRAGSPILRGLMGKQILILVDGVKLNNATFRFGPLQYLATLDLHMVDRIEIVRGVGSVLGSDALGGIINIVTKKGPGEQGAGGAVFSRYSTADQGLSGHAEVYAKTESMRGFAGGSYGQVKDLTAGGGVGAQPHTGGFDEKAANAHIDYFLSEDRTLSVGYQFLQQNKVPRGDRIADGTSLEYLFDPQRQQLANVSFEDLSDRGWCSLVQATAYWNRQDEGVLEIRPSQPSVERRGYDWDNMLGANLELGSFFGESHRLVYGADYSHEQIHSKRDDVDISSGKSSPKRGKYADGSTYNNFALYLQDRFEPLRALELKLGTRFSYFQLGGQQDSPVGPIDLGARNYAVTGTASVMLHATKKLNLVASVTPGFRAPNIDDVSVWDERKEGTEVPNPNVKPERIVDYEVGLKYLDEKVSASAFAYYSRLTNLLVRSDGTYAGLPFIDLDGNGEKGPGEPAVFQKQNIGRAAIYGAELDARWRPVRSIAIFGNLTQTTGQDLSLNEPLPRIPPLYGTFGARWLPDYSRNPWVEATLQLAAAQHQLGSVDKGDSRIGPDGTNGFQVLSVRGGLTALEGLRLTLGLENVFDQKYKYHGSGLFRPGRQVVAGLEYRL